jgi:hypothetical protein
MKQVRILSTDKLIKRDFLSYIGSLGASFRGVQPTDPYFDYAFDIISQSPTHRQHIITEVCRKLDTMDIAYEVVE